MSWKDLPSWLILGTISFIYGLYLVSEDIFSVKSFFGFSIPIGFNLSIAKFGIVLLLLCFFFIYGMILSSFIKVIRRAKWSKSMGALLGFISGILFISLLLISEFLNIGIIQGSAGLGAIAAFIYPPILLLITGIIIGAFFKSSNQ